MVAALLAAASKGLETTTYSVNFVSELAFAQGSVYFNETTVYMLEQNGVTVVSTSFEGTKYSFTVEEVEVGTTGSAMCDDLRNMLPYMKEICFTNGVSMGEVDLCPISSFENYEAQCTSNVASTYYLDSPLAATIPKEQIDALILGLYSNTLVRYVSSQMSTTRYTIDVTESYKGEFADMFCRWSSTFSYPGEICAVTSLSDGEKEHCKPFEGLACKPHSSKYEVIYPSIFASKFDKDTLDGLANTIITQMAQLDPAAAIVGSFNHPSQGIYTVFVNETASGSFGSSISTAISGNANIKCLVVEVSDDNKVHYSTPAECFNATDYKIEFFSEAAPMISDTAVNGMIVNMCKMAGFSGLRITPGPYSYNPDTAIYTFTVTEPFSGIFGNVSAISIQGTDSKCSIKTISGNGNVVYFKITDQADCYTTTVYEFGLSMNTPNTTKKEDIDKLVTMFMNDAVIFVDSNFTLSLYTLTVNEILEGSVGEKVCEIIPGATMMNPEVCFVSFIKSEDTTYCTPRTEDACAAANPGVTTLYEVKYYGNMSVPEELDDFFKIACENASEASGENVKFVSSTYDKKTYKPTIVEPRTGIFGNHFCKFISEGTYSFLKCDFGSLKAGGNDYCNHPECDNAAFGFAPLAFLMALIFAFFF